MSELPDLSKKGFSVESVAKRALEEKQVLSEVLEGILSGKDVTRYNSFKVLLFLSEKYPEVLHPNWDFFVGLIDSGGSSSKYIALHIIANLAQVDVGSKFEKIFDKYFDLLDEEKLPTAAHLAGNAGKIAKAKPKLQTRITERLLNIDKAHHSPEHKDLIKSYAIESLSEYFEETKNKEEITEFVKKQLKSKSLRARRQAQIFLEKWC